MDIPSTKEIGEIEANGGLSVSGSQLRALANLIDFRLRLFGSRYDKARLPIDLLNFDLKQYESEDMRIKDVAREEADQRTIPIQEMVMKGDTKQAVALIQPLLTIEPTHREELEQIIHNLDNDIPLEEVLAGDTDSPFSKFLKSLRGKRFEQAFQSPKSLVLTQFGIMAEIFPQRNAFHLEVPSPRGNWYTRVTLPLDQQHPQYLSSEEVFGNRDEETLASKKEVFDKLRAQGHATIYSHMTDIRGLTAILYEGHIGVDYNSFMLATNHGFYVARFDIPEPTENAKRQFPAYVEPTAVDPVVLCTQDVPIAATARGVLVDKGLDMTDPKLLGIWVTPTHRKHLLAWIGKWPENKRQQVFGNRLPESILLSSSQLRTFSVLTRCHSERLPACRQAGRGIFHGRVKQYFHINP